MGDVNGDGKADIVGFCSNGTYVALSTGKAFAALRYDHQLWRKGRRLVQPKLFHEFVADVSGDGKDDIVGFGTRASMCLCPQAAVWPPTIWLHTFWQGQRLDESGPLSAHPGRCQWRWQKRCCRLWKQRGLLFHFLQAVIGGSQTEPGRFWRGSRRMDQPDYSPPNACRHRW